MNVFKQTCSVTAMSLRSLPMRVGASLVVVMGIAAVVAVLISVLAMARGLSETVARAGHESRAIVLRKGADSEGASVLPRSAADAIEAAPGVRRSSDGNPISSREMLGVVSAARLRDGLRAEVIVRGLSKSGPVLRSEVTLTAGRMMRPGVRELVAGRAVQLQYRNMKLGDTVKVRNADWTIVGYFQSNGDARESELLTDADTLMSAYEQNVYQSVTVLLDSPAAFDTFKNTLMSDPSLSVEVYRERDYYKQRSDRLDTLLFIVAYVVGGIMAVGAAFGAVNVMYSAIESRRVEIATLRAIGFDSAGVAASVLVEGVLLAVTGATVGAGIAWFAFDNNLITTSQGAGDIVFKLHIDATLLALGVLWACSIALLGGLFPAIKAGRMPVAAALRSG